MNNKVKNRWLIALAAVGIHISIGSVYSWSVFTKHIQHDLGFSLSEVSRTFSIAILFLGLSAAFMGHFVEKFGPRISGLVSTIFFISGLVLSSYAISVESLPLLYLGYGVLSGIGLGIGYIAPVSTLVKWFPDKRGLATGLAIMGFGFASMIASPVIEFLITHFSLTATFIVLAAVYFVVMVISSLYLSRPPENYKPRGMNPHKASKKKPDLVQITANEAIKTKRFYYLWFMLFINVTCGIAILSVASPMGQEIVNLTSGQAATMVGIIGVFNGLGRLIWASISDFIGRTNVYTVFFIIQIVLFLWLPTVDSPVLFQIILFIIISCYGGGFSSIPAYIGDIFGTKQLGAIHGYILTAWAAAGLVGPGIASTVREVTQSYMATLYIFAAFFIVALAISFLIRVDIKRIKDMQTF
ncbi:OFA family MFS transporter [Mammaliicoccus stepanovicii]|uniref:Oxalate:formate exchange protein n=1 Tax=Mammaliicoccus stepanovicii TaxID=643214 RepID=A0A239YRA9_9STAP|nr:OFA family MFS transporter [Mammaliicoccus stepanovicii]PNZ73226.1 MFS transporter [Mammaliicoccus stepanovicii]GGI42407.1 MFS transporter [Mammaliicoccus stepanovicii]SNV61307.1 Oxalate:formate exchange protein [Mammaliicoccus stepanovicii]